jgi:hypothetical protein
VAGECPRGHGTMAAPAAFAVPCTPLTPAARCPAARAATSYGVPFAPPRAVASQVKLRPPHSSSSLSLSSPLLLDPSLLHPLAPRPVSCGPCCEGRCLDTLHLRGCCACPSPLCTFSHPVCTTDSVAVRERTAMLSTVLHALCTCTLCRVTGMCRPRSLCTRCLLPWGASSCGTTPRSPHPSWTRSSPRCGVCVFVFVCVCESVCMCV